VLANNLNGKIIDVGSATQGRLNPFHIIASAEDEEGGDEGNTSFNMHLQFLEEFFRQILPGINPDSMEYLNNLLVRLYDEKGISVASDLSKLKPADFPNFDDLYDKILIDYQRSKGEYSKDNLQTLMNYISKFSTGGRNSALWNGEATLATNENFIVFNFQSLLANKNGTLANAQMLLVLKWLDNEIIKNRDYNLRYGANRKIIVVIDEAHVFIDEKYPIALDFMYQLAKRIRKYNGMQIIITQNIKDFVGTEELAKKSTAIINACQYSFIFPLAPNDMHDLVKLYEKAGAINQNEQEEIISNGRGRAFVVTSPTDRTSIDIVATDEVQTMFTQ
jgi:type IV secretory pathway VirB4 component